MAEEIKVNPTPIQRNPLDVATELTEFYYSTKSFNSVEELTDTFMKFFAVASGANYLSPKYYTDYMPEKLARIVKS